MIDLVVNFDTPEAKRDLMMRLGGLRGTHVIVVKKYRKTRTGQQNRFYHAVIVRLFREFLLEQGEQYTHDEVHEIFKAKFLLKDVTDPRTGEVLCTRVRSTTTLNKDEFSIFIEQCITWLADMFGIVTPDPQLYLEAA